MITKRYIPMKQNPQQIYLDSAKEIILQIEDKKLVTVHNQDATHPAMVMVPGYIVGGGSDSDKYGKCYSFSEVQPITSDEEKSKLIEAIMHTPELNVMRDRIHFWSTN